MTATMVVSTPTGHVHVQGTQLGRASSKRGQHTHEPDEAPVPYKRCSACRWTEITVFRAEEGYVLVLEGMSSVTGEVPYGRVREVELAGDVVDNLYRVDRRENRDARPFLPLVARRALLDSARNDSDLAAALRLRGLL
jgi:hypothetical protein